VERLYINNDPAQGLDTYFYSVVATFQLRYQNVDLPWVGRIQEKVHFDPKLTRNHNAKTNPPPPAASQWAAVFTSNASGVFQDSKGAPIDDPKPDAGKYHVLSYHQEHRNVENANAAVGPAFKVYHWMDNAEAGGMEIER
jgi:hypothetical protein